MKKMTVAAMIVLCWAISIFGQQARERPPLPADELELRTRLEADKSVVKITCGLLLPIDPKEMYAAEATKRQAENTRVKLAFYKAAKDGKTFRAGYDCGTDEGGTIRKYLLSEYGKLTFVDDYSRDPFGGLRIRYGPCEDLRLGHYVVKENKEIVFETFDERETAGKIVFLQCTSEKLGGFIF